MKRMILIIKIFIGILAFCGIIIFMWLRSLFGPYSTSDSIKKEFYKNYDIIFEITSYIGKAGYENINIQGTDYIYDDGDYGTWYVQNGDANDTENDGTKEIEDEKIIKELLYLFKDKKYQVINKNGNTISFQLCSNLDTGRGIAYTIDGLEPTLQFLTKVEKLDKNNWYYYEEDFNEWKQLN